MLLYTVAWRRRASTQPDAERNRGSEGLKVARVQPRDVRIAGRLVGAQPLITVQASEVSRGARDSGVIGSLIVVRRDRLHDSKTYGEHQSF